ncbi:hypothetical protein F5Y14DRAFT_457500 [Nemania sp. NC0429]|nr:hypothetical protein F5Y14DRAFT_457500 [Nemania sp. NC0429]
MGKTEAHGRLAGDKLWHVHRYPKAPGTLIVIGSVLTDLEKKIELLTPEDTFNETPAVRLAVKEHVSKNTIADLSAGLPACLAPLISVGAGVDGEASSLLENEIEALGVKVG